MHPIHAIAAARRAELIADAERSRLRGPSVADGRHRRRARLASMLRRALADLRRTEPGNGVAR
jgi:hypothetical protein